MSDDRQPGEAFAIGDGLFKLGGPVTVIGVDYDDDDDDAFYTTVWPSDAELYARDRARKEEREEAERLAERRAQAEDDAIADAMESDLRMEERQLCARYESEDDD